MDKLERNILGIGIGIFWGIFCSVIGTQLVLYSDIKELKKEVKELCSDDLAFKLCFKELGFKIGFEESEQKFPQKNKGSKK